MPNKMENQVITKAGILFKKGIFQLLSLFIIFSSVLSGCASSDVSRDASSNVDVGVQNAKNLYGDAMNGDVSDSYQNASQAAKGAMLGGAAGAATGALSSGLGVIPGAATGAILGAAYGSYIDTNVSLQDKLENRGANIIVLGDQILIVVPSARLFNPMTATLKPQAYSTLYKVAQYINSYTKMLVKVTAYTDDSGTSSIDLALSKQQAERVAKVLLASGIDARVLYAVGAGGTRLVTKNSMDWDSDNYRIEITLEKLYV